MIALAKGIEVSSAEAHVKSRLKERELTAFVCDQLILKRSASLGDPLGRLVEQLHQTTRVSMTEGARVKGALLTNKAQNKRLRDPLSL
jgi:hypothetical protein